jgi:Flp pilus assembly pilin Flp
LHEQESTGVASRRARDDKGQVLVEYALLLALISVVSIGVLASLGLDIKDVLLQASSRMSQVSNP